jgi:hypothetical protein
MNDLDTISYQEALRDIKLIEAEVRRRDTDIGASDEENCMPASVGLPNNSPTNANLMLPERACRRLMVPNGEYP